MYPNAFDYFRPDSLAEAVRLLGQYGEDARPLAGGQSLIPLMKLRVANPAVLVDLNPLPGLGDVQRPNRRAPPAWPAPAQRRSSPWRPRRRCAASRSTRRQSTRPRG